MNTLNHLKGNFILSGVAVSLSFLGKKIWRKEILPVSSTGQITKSYFFILITTIVGKLAMDKIYQNHWLPYSAGGKKKVENEGFIGPIHGDLFYAFMPVENPYVYNDPNKK